MSESTADMPDAKGADAAPVPFPLGRSALVLGGLVLVVAGAAHVGLSRAGWEGHVAGNLIGAVTCGGGGLLGLLPVWSMSRRDRHGAAWGFMAGILLRMIACGAVIMGLQWGGYAHAGVATFYVGGWYLLVLTAEVKLVSSFLLAHAGPPGMPPGTTP